MTTVSRKQVGPFTLVRFPTLGKVDIRVDYEGGPMSLKDFEREVCPWDELGEGMEERVREFYAKWFQTT